MTQNKIDEEDLIKVLNMFVEKVVPIIAENAFGVVIVPPLPDIRDFTPEATRKRQLKVLKRSIKRRRKLSAEDMLNIYLLHKGKRVSFRSIARQFSVSEWTVRKTFQKVVIVLRNVK